jgi:hypothetical protein
MKGLERGDSQRGVDESKRPATGSGRTAVDKMGSVKSAWDHLKLSWWVWGEAR